VPRAAAAEAATAHAHAHVAVCDAASDGASSEWQTTLATISKAVVVLKARAVAATALRRGGCEQRTR
jgi:hypothetical protein